MNAYSTTGDYSTSLLGYIVLKLFNIYDSFGSPGCILQIRFLP